MTLVQKEVKRITIRPQPPRLPAEYQEVKYIENTSTSYIDTWLVCNYWYKMELKYYTSSSGSGSITSDQTVLWPSIVNGATPLYYWINHGAAYKWIYLNYNNAWHDILNTQAVWNTYEASVTIRNWNQTVVLDWNTVYSATATVSWTWWSNLFVFARWTDTHYAAIKLYFLKIYDVNDVKIRDFVPCYRKADSVIGLYDIVNDVFYTNSWWWIFAKWENVWVEKQIRPAQWSLRVPSTITWSTLVSSKATFSEWSDTQWMYISPDGTKLYVPFRSNKRLYQYSMSTPFDASTATAVRYIWVTTPDWIYFDDTGTYMFIGSETWSKILRYTLSTPRDISTAIQDQTLSLWSYFALTICLSLDGKHIYYWKYNGSQDVVYQQTLSTPYDLTTAWTATSKYFGSNSRAWTYVRNDGKYAYIRGGGSWIWQYELATPYDITSTATEIWTMSIWWDCRNIWVSNDCKYWAIDYWSVGNGQWIKIYQSVKL